LYSYSATISGPVPERSPYIREPPPVG
jgi:hypothetical protein